MLFSFHLFPISVIRTDSTCGDIKPKYMSKVQSTNRQEFYVMLEQIASL